MSYETRAKKQPTAVGRALLALMVQKKSNLAFSADIGNTADFLAMADAVGPFICILKTHIDLISDFGPATIAGINSLAAKHRFLIFEDRKFGDIGSTVQGQYGSGTFRIVEWAHIVNAHIVPGEGIVEGLETVARQQSFPVGRGLLLLAEMSSAGSIATVDYTNTALEMARKHKDFVLGFVANGTIPGQKRGQDEDFLIFTTGINLSTRDNPLGQCYQTPNEAVSRGSDVIIVGRGIYGSSDPVKAAMRYQQEGWEAYKRRLG